MTPEEQIKNLREQIAYHSDRYYNQDNPEISDYEFDQLMLELKRLEREHPELVTPDSPTQKVGGTAKRRLCKFQLFGNFPANLFFIDDLDNLLLSVTAIDRNKSRRSKTFVFPPLRLFLFCRAGCLRSLKGRSPPFHDPRLLLNLRRGCKCIIPGSFWFSFRADVTRWLFLA